MATLNEDFIYGVLFATKEIPRGKVATYGQLARLIGNEKNARLVGKALQVSSFYGGDYPCHRVVNSSGRLVPGWEAQQGLLEGEGILFKENGHVDLKRCQWEA